MSDLEFYHWHIYFPREINLPQNPPDLMTDSFRFLFCLIRIRVLDYGFLFFAKEKTHTPILESVFKCVYSNCVMKNIIKIIHMMDFSPQETLTLESCLG